MRGAVVIRRRAMAVIEGAPMFRIAALRAAELGAGWCTGRWGVMTRACDRLERLTATPDEEREQRRDHGGPLPDPSSVEATFHSAAPVVFWRLSANKPRNLDVPRRRGELPTGTKDSQSLQTFVSGRKTTQLNQK
jgi:hypothetical protein